MSKVFISYSKKDSYAVQDIYLKLKQHGFSPWIDSEELLPGQVWEIEIEKAIRNSSAVLICFSQQMMSSPGYVHKEWRYAVDVMLEMPEDKVYIIPVRLDDCSIPAKLQKIQWVNWYNKNEHEKLFRSLAYVSNKATSTNDIVQPNSIINNAAPEIRNYFGMKCPQCHRHNVRDIESWCGDYQVDGDWIEYFKTLCMDCGYSWERPTHSSEFAGDPHYEGVIKIPIEEE